MNNDDFRIVFMGTPDFAVESLKRLNENFKIVAVVTAPDKPRGRGQEITPTPVKKFAIENSLPVLQPANMKSEDFIEALKLLKPDLIVIVAFRMLPEVVWSLPRLGSINLHASLLPQYRGAAPINHAIINGETLTGVTTFFLQHEIDTGNIIQSKEVIIEHTDNAGTLHDKLMLIGAEVLIETVQSVKDNNYTATPQNILDINKLKLAPKINKDFCSIDWNQNGKSVNNFIRGLSPYPGAFTQSIINQKPVYFKIYNGYFEEENNNSKPGTVLINKNQLKVSVSDGWYIITEIQQSGKKRMFISDFLNGLGGQNDTIKLHYTLNPQTSNK